MSNWSVELLRSVLDAAPEGISICEADGERRVVYVNPAYVRLTGYEANELIGQNLRVLQGVDRDQPGRQLVRAALERGEPCRATIRNVRKDGTFFLNEMLIQPLRDADNRVTHFIGYHHEPTAMQRTGDTGIRGLPAWVRDDRLTGVSSRSYFEDVLKRDVAVAQREGRELTLLLFDVDELTSYNETFERIGGDAALRRVARVLGSCFRRGSDLVARWDGGGFIVLVASTGVDRAWEYAQTVLQRIRDQQLHHPRSAAKILTVSAGVVVRTPTPDDTAMSLVKAAEVAVKRAKLQGRNRSLAAVDDDYRAKA
jgi:diguanylate cyclase (GGDEF)-like protein/PAS domain S-box-containing protein